MWWLSRIKAHIPELVVVVLTVIGAYAFGRYGQPPKVVEKIKYVDREVSSEHLHEMIKEVIAAQELSRSDAVDNRNMKRETLTTWHPDGSVTVAVTETDLGVKTVTVVKEKKVDVIRTVEVVRQVEVIKTVEVEKTKIVEAEKPQWRVGALVGYDHDRQVFPSPYPIVYGASSERRILGPIWAGVWIKSDVSAGLQMSLEF